jgi:hypothetical protein
MSYNSPTSCSRCGAPIRPAARFCPKCGTAVAAIPSRAPEPPAPSRASSASKLPWALAGAALVILAGIVLVGGCVLIKSGAQATETPIALVGITPTAEGETTPGGPVPTAPPKLATLTRAPAATPTSEVPDYLKCDSQKLPFPLPADAQGCQHLDPITDFRTNLSPAQVVQFYKDYLEKNGWQRKDDGALPGLGIWVTGSKRLAVGTSIEKNMTSVQIQYTTQ